MCRAAHLWLWPVILALLLGGCGTKRPPSADAPPVPADRDLPGPPAHSDAGASTGVIHTVRRGETLYSIARAYGTDVDEIAVANHLQDVNRLEVGQRLLIPGAAASREVPLPGSTGGRAGGLAWPLRGEILSLFGAPRPGRRHAGLDIRGQAGEPVMASARGHVTFSGTMRGYGKVVILDHGGGLETRYAHNRKLLVRAGERVFRGQKIATVGRSGNAKGDHLHFEVRRNRVAVDPLKLLGN